MADLTPPGPTERSAMETPIYDRLVRERGIDPVTPHYRQRVLLGTPDHAATLHDLQDVAAEMGVDLTDEADRG